MSGQPYQASDGQRVTDRDKRDNEPFQPHIIRAGPPLVVVEESAQRIPQRVGLIPVLLAVCFPFQQLLTSTGSYARCHAA